MATGKPKTQCFTCSKETRTYPCGGCSQNFCFNDLTKHLQTLSGELDAIENDHDQLRKKVIDQKGDSKHRPLIQQINLWEKDSIKKIEQTAKECREILTTYTDKFIIEMEKKLNDIAAEITKTRKENEFNETDLDELKEKLTKLANELDEPPNASIKQQSASLINKISVVIKEFAAPGSYNELSCKGRLCAKCGKCRDWYFTGDMATWHWIRNIKSWKDNDYTRWRTDRIHERFKRSDRATCLYLYYGSYSYSYGSGHDSGLHLSDSYLPSYGCLCENNVDS